ncbi:MAG: hypothetical protein ACOZCL_19435 [Bacillota bacterium]
MAAPEARDYKKRNLIYNTQEEYWAYEDESAYFELIKYMYPEDSGCTPFSSNSYYHHFIEAGGLTYLGEYEDFMHPYSNEGVLKAVPMGYKSILVFERVCLYDNGKIVFERDMPEIEHSEDSYIGKYVVLSSQQQRYTIPSWGEHELVTCEVKVNNENKLYVDAIQDLQSAKKVAEEYSLKDNAKCIVCQIIEYVDWH